MTRFYITKERLQTTLNLLPVGEYWFELAVEHGLLRILTVDRDFSVYTYTDLEVIAEGDQPKDAAKLSAASMANLADTLNAIEEDNTQLTVIWGEPQIDRLKLEWKAGKAGKNKHQCTLAILLEPFPVAPTFNLSESIGLDPAILKVLDVHSTVAKQADDDQVSGIWLAYNGPAEDVAETKLRVSSTDQVRILESNVPVVECLRTEPAKIILPEYGARVVSKSKRFDTVRLDLANVTWEMCHNTGKGDNAYEYRVLMRSIVKAQGKEISFTRLSAPSRPGGSVAEHSRTFKLSSIKFRDAIHFASRITSNSGAIGVTPGVDAVEFSGVMSEDGYSRIEVATIGKVQGETVTINLNARLMQAAANLMSSEDIVDVTLNPVGPNLIEFPGHGFAIMPMTFKEAKGEETND